MLHLNSSSILVSFFFYAVLLYSNPKKTFKKRGDATKESGNTIRKIILHAGGIKITIKARGFRKDPFFLMSSYSFGTKIELTYVAIQCKPS